MIEELKRAIRSGSPSNKYMLELSWGNLDSRRLNILCKAASLPENKINPVTVAYHGRKLHLRGDTDYPSTYEITIYDDDNLSFRKFFDKWLLAIDDPGKYKTKLTDDNPGSGFLNNLIEGVKDIKDNIEDNINDIKDLPNRVTDTVSDWFYGFTGMGSTTAGKLDFATPLKIWQLDWQGNKVYGYELENAYPISLGSIQYGADKQNELVEFSVTFAFSSFSVCS